MSVAPRSAFRQRTVDALVAAEAILGTALVGFTDAVFGTSLGKQFLTSLRSSWWTLSASRRPGVSANDPMRAARGGADGSDGIDAPIGLNGEYGLHFPTGLAIEPDECRVQLAFRDARQAVVLARGTIRWRAEADKKGVERVIPMPAALRAELRSFRVSSVRSVGSSFRRRKTRRCRWTGTYSTGGSRSPM